jgi:hypothetical protein
MSMSDFRKMDGLTAGAARVVSASIAVTRVAKLRLNCIVEKDE